VPDLLVTGTDTGVGKTVIAAAFVKGFRARGIRALGFKPVESGIEEGVLSDSEVLAGAAGGSVALAAPVARLREPLAPAIAAERANTRIDAREIERRIAALRSDGFTLVVEGAGGVTVPLCSEGSSFYSALDLAERCRLHAVVVARAGLGTLNHVMLTVDALRSRSIPVRAIVLNRVSAAPDLAEMTNAGVLGRMIPAILIKQVPDFPDEDLVETAAAHLRDLILGLE